MVANAVALDKLDHWLGRLLDEAGDDRRRPCSGGAADTGLAEFEPANSPRLFFRNAPARFKPQSITRFIHDVVEIGVQAQRPGDLREDPLKHGVRLIGRKQVLGRFREQSPEPSGEPAREQLAPAFAVGAWILNGASRAGMPGLELGSHAHESSYERGDGIQTGDCRGHALRTSHGGESSVSK